MRGASGLVYSYFAMWCVPDWPYGPKVAYVMVSYILFNICVSAYHTPYSALIMHLSNVPAERDSATMYRILFEIMGTLIGATFQGQLTAALYGPIGVPISVLPGF
jgi:Na+/melibiose symporter-like transporter